MKKFTAIILISIFSSYANATTSIMTNPIQLMLGLPNIEYQQSLDDTAGFTAQYASLFYGGGDATIMGGSYKSSFKNQPENRFGSGAYWRVGLVQVSVASGSSAVGGVLPVATVGYDYKINKNFLLNIDIGIFNNGLSLGYTF